ncbi:unnamed protein product [Cuscuta europaea]|uniref:Gnk2-homologous domain-containing protein n=1 Tax=Cuscuta europaea TaxID=41803 RepID=A0A9P1EH47_CUSEU|nr:unnamed protein product [Cuscuta europaea]
MARLLSSYYFLAFLIISIILIFSPSSLLSQSDSSANDLLSRVYSTCNPAKYTAGSPFESNLNSLFASLVNSAAISSYNNFTAAGPVNGGAPGAGATAYGLYQCRGDLSLPDCATCVSGVVKQFAGICPQMTGGVLQVVGCLAMYDAVNFIGVQNKTVALRECGRPDAAVANTVDAVLKGLSGPAGVSKLNADYEAIGMSQCVGDLSVEMCEDCLGEAIQQLRTTCSAAVSGEMFLGKCYARYMIGQSRKGWMAQFTSLFTNWSTESHSDHVKALIIVGCILAFVLLLLLILLCLCRRKTRNDKPQSPKGPKIDPNGGGLYYPQRVPPTAGNPPVRVDQV